MSSNVASSSVAEKLCSCCKKIKPASAFYASAVLKSGLRSRCIECESIGAAERSRAWYNANKERAAVARKVYANANAERLAESKKVWVNANRDKLSKANRDYRARHKDKVNTAARERERQNPDARRLARAKWDANNPEVRRAITRNRRAKIKGSSGRVTSRDVESILRMQKYKCAVCRIDLRESGHHMDHIMPIALGGDNSVMNLQATCPQCNQSKGAKNPVDFMQSRGFLL